MNSPLKDYFRCFQIFWLYCGRNYVNVSTSLPVDVPDHLKCKSEYYFDRNKDENTKFKHNEP